MTRKNYRITYDKGIREGIHYNLTPNELRYVLKELADFEDVTVETFE